MQSWTNYPQQTLARNPYPFTNVAYVTSLEEALYRTTQYGSDMIYFHQDKNEFYRVRVETDGHKSYVVFSYTLPQSAQPQEENTLEKLTARVEALEKLMQTTEAAEHEKSVG